MTKPFPISEIAHLYEISDKGQVWSVRRKIWMKLKTNRDGYRHIRLSNDTKKYATTIHRAVASAFIPNPNTLPEVNHKDGNKKRNVVDNLEWCTRSENMKHAHATGIIKTLRGERHGMAKLTADTVREMRALHGEGFTKNKLGKMFGVSGVMAGLIVNNKNWKHII